MDTLRECAFSEIFDQWHLGMCKVQYIYMKIIILLNLLSLSYIKCTFFDSTFHVKVVVFTFNI